MLLEFRQVTGISKKFHLEQISFGLPLGYIMGLAGKNGAGKTTLIDYIMNPENCYTGSILINGVDIRKNHTKMLDEVGFVSENHVFLLERTARQNAELLGGFYSNWDSAVFEDAMKRMEVPATISLNRMSRGENMKFQMAFAMAHKPVLYLLDEVTAGMNPVFRIDFFKILQEIISTEEVSILMTTHMQEEMERKMDYIGVLEQGKLLSFREG